jgi:voltage-gated potassium channel
MAEGNQGLGPRILSGLGAINNLLLIPLLAMILIESTRDQGASELLSPQTSSLVFCVPFLLESILSVWYAESRIKWLKNPVNLLELVSALPFGLVFQGARFVRLIRLTKLFRVAIRSRHMGPKLASLGRLAAIVGTIGITGAFALHAVEPETAPTLTDAMWWALVTVSTVGYGDISPVSDTGRIMASLLIISGIGSFGYIAGVMSSLLEEQSEDEASLDDVMAAVKRIEARLDELEDT